MEKKNRKIVLIGGVNSVGVPYTRDNINHISHFHLVKSYLEKLGFEIEAIDTYSMSKYNTTTVLDQYLKDNTSLEQIKKNQIESVDLCRKQGFFQWMQLSPKTKKLYDINANDEKIFFSSKIKENNSIFIYSCGANDFLKIMNTDLGKMLRRKEMQRALEKMDSSISKIISNIKNNFDSILMINSKIKVYVLGLYVPTRFNYIRKRVELPIGYFNKSLKKLCDSYKNVYFVDNSNLTKNEMASIDWHPNYKGQCLIGENIIKLLK